jgi:2-polyprenyl-6-methoxyphenol hydroxylase-like FAD-dependent oxidoreductase
MPHSDISIAIIGGGLGGLTAALALARHGQPVRVLEGAPSFGAIGFGIQFGPNVFHVLDRIGVSDAVLEKADSPSAVVLIDGLTGMEVTRVSTGPSLRARFASLHHHPPDRPAQRPAGRMPTRSAHHARSRRNGDALCRQRRPGHRND